jgi:membrane protein DedA with SNARE-associated domain
MLFGAILLDGLGLPLAGELVLIGAGAAMRVGAIDPGAGFAVAVAAALAGHCGGYWAGRLFGPFLLPAAAHFTPGPAGVVFGRFLVGVRVVLCPLAGVARMRFRWFLVLDAVGACIWVAVFILLGYAGGAYLDMVRPALEANRGSILIGVTAAAALLALPGLLRRPRPAAPVA